MNARGEKLREALQHAAAEFLAREASRQSLVTVTNAAVSDDGRRGTVFITVFPDTEEEKALEFANRHARECAEFFKTQVRGVHVPHVEFVIDRGEKNRQRLDELGK
jgi:ribosome-binding factor A